jgi:hypothetical protein
MPYYPRPPVAINNLPKPERHRIALAAWRRVIRNPLFLALFALNCLAVVLPVAQASVPLVRAVIGYVPLLVWFWTYGDFIDCPGFAAFLGYVFLLPSLYRRAVRDILRDEGLSPAACLMSGWDLGGLDCYSCPGWGSGCS